MAHDSTLNVQIFGTDIDDRAIEFARAGRYGRTVGISPERLQRWFYEIGGDFVPIRQIRSMCVFSVHNVTKDPPFSKLDLISCRNLLIYMDTVLQDLVLRSFHYGLNPHSLLFLGLSEGVSSHTDLFTIYDKGAHLFVRRDADGAFPNLPIPLHQPTATPVPESYKGYGDRVERNVRAALAKYSPAFLVVDRQSTIVRYSGGEVVRYLEPVAGPASLSLMSNLRKNLRSVVRGALQSVMKTGDGAIIDNVSMIMEGQHRLVCIIIEPVLNAGGEEYYVIAFQDIRVIPADVGNQRKRRIRRRSFAAPGHNFIRQSLIWKPRMKK